MAESTTRSTGRLPVILAAVGLLLSIGLEALHLKTYLMPEADSFCSVGQSFDCVAVAASRFSVLGLPWAIWGIVGFLGLLSAAIRRSYFLLPLSVVAALVSIVLLIVEVVGVGSICLLCEAVHVVALALLWASFRERASLSKDFNSATTWNTVFIVPGSSALAVWLFLPHYWLGFNYRSEPPVHHGVTEEGHHYIGAKEPELTVHEFTDYHCPHCKVASTRSLWLLAKNPGLRLVRRQHPRMHCLPGTQACDAARLALCAAEQGKFWQADRWLFSEVEPRAAIPIDKMAEALKLDATKLKACAAKPETYKKVDAEATFAFKRRIVSTPGYLVNGRKLSEKEATEFQKTGRVTGEK